MLACFYFQKNFQEAIIINTISNNPTIPEGSKVEILSINTVTKKALVQLSNQTIVWVFVSDLKRL